MHKRLSIFVVVGLFAAALSAQPAFAGNSKDQKSPNPNSLTGQLYFSEAQQVEASIAAFRKSAKNEVKGKMNYAQTGPEFTYVFNAHGLKPGDEYTLIYYPWPDGEGLIELGGGTVNQGGNIHIEGSTETCNLPIPCDQNDGAEIRLVLTSELQQQPYAFSQYLCGSYLISFEDSDSSCPEECVDNELPWWWGGGW